MSDRVKKLLGPAFVLGDYLKGEVLLEDGSTLMIYDENRLPEERLLSFDPEISFIYDVSLTDGWLVLRKKVLAKGRFGDIITRFQEECIPAAKVKKLWIRRR